MGKLKIINERSRERGGGCQLDPNQWISHLSFFFFIDFIFNLKKNKYYAELQRKTLCTIRTISQSKTNICFPNLAFRCKMTIYTLFILWKVFHLCLLKKYFEKIDFWPCTSNFVRDSTPKHIVQFLQNLVCILKTLW